MEGRHVRRNGVARQDTPVEESIKQVGRAAVRTWRLAIFRRWRLYIVYASLIVIRRRPRILVLHLVFVYGFRLLYVEGCCQLGKRLCHEPIEQVGSAPSGDLGWEPSVDFGGQIGFPFLKPSAEVRVVQWRVFIEEAAHCSQHLEKVGGLVRLRDVW